MRFPMRTSSPLAITAISSVVEAAMPPSLSFSGAMPDAKMQGGGGRCQRGRKDISDIENGF
jgi:hypothetical protein